MLKWIINDWRDFKKYAGEWLFLKRNAQRIKWAISLADLKQRVRNRQYHIVLLTLYDGKTKFVSLSRGEFLKLKNRKLIGRNVRWFDLIHSDAVFYSTPAGRNNKESRELRRKAVRKYISWIRLTKHINNVL